MDVIKSRNFDKLPSADPYGVQEAHAKACLAKMDGLEKQRIETLKKKEENSSIYRNVIVCILILAFLIFMSGVIGNR